MTTGRTLWVGLDLLDRQLVDIDGRPIAKVDDIEISPSQPGDELPSLTALLCGPAALGKRFGRRTGAFFIELRGLLRDVSNAQPIHIDMDLVTEIGTAVKVGSSRQALPVTAVERFLGEHLIGHIPGAGVPGPENESEEQP